MIIKKGGESVLGRPGGVRQGHVGLWKCQHDTKHSEGVRAAAVDRVHRRAVGDRRGAAAAAAATTNTANTAAAAAVGPIHPIDPVILDSVVFVRGVVILVDLHSERGRQ